MGCSGSRENFVPEMQRLCYDMSPLTDAKLPIIWLIGAPGTGRDTQAAILEDFYSFDVLKISSLLKQHATNETDRGRVIKENFMKKNKLIPDTIVIDIIKEEILSRTAWANGFVLNGFPRNANQADMFVKEACDVDVILYLTCKVPTMVSRSLFKSDSNRLVDVKVEIALYNKHLAQGIKKYSAKIEKFDTTKDSPDIIFPKIQSAIDVRVFPDGNKKDNTNVHNIIDEN
ncbi:PREDICTED: adenylate kinase-like [Nicrophorus vespilloides]|uniref:Adenylate kinase-like n=1 Tax=Nicrophorus vespilloides TaxID=110193 RepID=A0ABM1MGV8_NICVS|nr:PREDICTED: adenylate kinase-like [Nicrophorus vespilloides]